MEEEWKPIKESLVENAKGVCGTRYVGCGIRKCSEWWNKEVKRKVDEKKKTFGEWLQRGDRESYERCKTINVEVKRMVKDAKKEASNRWGREFGRSFEENKKNFGKN